MSFIPQSAFAANVLPHGDIAKWRVGEPPPRPWVRTGNRTGVTLQTVSLEGRKWLEFRDASTEGTASILCKVPTLRAGRLSLRVRMADDHDPANGIFFCLGTGEVSKDVERVVDVKTSPSGVLYLGSANQRVATGLTLAAGADEHLFIEFRPAAQGIQLRLGRIGDDGQDQLLKEETIAQPARPVDHLRIMSHGKTAGAHFFLTDLQLTPLNTP